MDKIAVIGAGPMGLAVAYELLNQNVEVEIFESDDRVGGMTACFDFDGVDIERYYHFHCTADYHFFDIIKELKIDDQLKWVNTKMGYWYNNELQEWGNPIALLKFKGLSLLAKFRYGFHAFMCTKIKNWKKLEKEDAQSWIKKWVGKEAYSVLWERLIKLKFYHFSDNLSSPWIWSRIRRIGQSRESIFKEKLGYLNGGSNTLLKSLSEVITQKGGRINLRAKVDKLCVTDNKFLGLQVNGEFKKFDKVISTIPLPIFGYLIQDLEESKKYTSKKNIGVVCVIVKMKKALTNNFWLNINDEEMNIPGIIEYSNLNPSVGHIAYVPYYVPREHMIFKQPDDYFRSKIKSYFKKINKTFSNGDFLSIRVHRYSHAQPICEPNFLDLLPNIKLDIDNILAADTSFYYPEDRGISDSIGFGRFLAKTALNV